MNTPIKVQVRHCGPDNPFAELHYHGQRGGLIILFNHDHPAGVRTTEEYVMITAMARAAFDEINLRLECEQLAITDRWLKVDGDIVSKMLQTLGEDLVEIGNRKLECAK